MSPDDSAAHLAMPRVPADRGVPVVEKIFPKPAPGKVDLALSNNGPPPVPRVKLAAEIGQVIDIADFIFEDSDLRQVDRSVKGDFSLRSFDLKTRIPSASIGTVEPPTQGGGVGEGGIDNPGVRDAKYELGHADAGQEVVLGKHLFIRRPVELGDRR